MRLYQENKLTFLVLIILISLATPVLANGCAKLPAPLARSTDFQIFQTCNDCTYCNFTFFEPGDYFGVKYAGDTDDNWRYYKNLSSGNNSELGVYRYDYICGNNDNVETGCIEFEVNPKGTFVGENQDIALISQFGVLALFLTLGIVWNRNKWKMKTFFFISALLVSVITINSMNIIFGTSSGLYMMGQILLVLSISVTSILMAWFFVMMTIDLTQKFKKKKDDKWRLKDYD